MYRARPLDLRQLFLQLLDASAQHAPVSLELGFALPASNPDASNLARQVGPAARLTRQLVLNLCEFDLGARFACSRLPDEEFEDQGTSINDCALDDFFQIPDLPRCQIVVEDHDVGTQLVRCAGNLTDLCRGR